MFNVIVSGAGWKPYRDWGMRSRIDKNPGEWKNENNQAGPFLVVARELVQRTLREGFERIQALETALARALMTMFVVSEVHPFKEGNGRTARLAMNCVLSAAVPGCEPDPTRMNDALREWLRSYHRAYNHRCLNPG